MCIVGNDTSVYANTIKSQVISDGLPITFTGTLEHERTLNLIAQSDVVICASREESMSMAITEGLMYGKIVIVSSNCRIYQGWRKWIYI